MRADRHSRRPATQRPVDQTDIRHVARIGITAALRIGRAACRIAQPGKRRVVELQIGAAKSGEPCNLVAIHGGEIGNQVVAARIDLVIRGRAGNACHRAMQHAGRGNCQLRRRGRDGFEETKVLAEDRPGQPDLLVYPDGIGGEFQVFLAAMEGHAHLFRQLGDAGDLVEEIHMPGSPTDLAVGDALQPNLLLQLHQAADCGIFDRPQLLGRDQAGLMILARLADVGGAQQAADMIGSKRRLLAGCHDVPPPGWPGLIYNASAFRPHPLPRGSTPPCGAHRRR